LIDLVRPRSRFDLLAVIPLALVVYALLSIVVPLTFGPLAFVGVVEEQAFLFAILLLAPLALLARARSLAFGLVAAAVVGGLLFGSEWISLPGAGAGRADLTVMTWNLEYQIRTPEETVAQLQGVDADLVAIEEMEPDVAQAIQADPALTTRYPYRLMAPRRGAWGTGLLSRYPLSDTRASYPPACLEMLVATPRGPLRVIVGHPNHAALSTMSPLRVLVGYDSTNRDAEIASIREKIDASLAAGERLLVVGDFNTTPTEPAFRVLTKDLRDTHVEVGEGPGWTWRLGSLTFLPVGFLRIDLQLSAGAIRPTSTWMDCSLPGDHCRLFGTYEID
jgi:endonuclease/exonuclease/phosphatase family metal-dependent hydrolase